jgi:hypothetical protein
MIALTHLSEALGRMPIVTWGMLVALAAMGLAGFAIHSVCIIVTGRDHGAPKPQRSRRNDT